MWVQTAPGLWEERTSRTREGGSLVGFTFSLIRKDPKEGRSLPEKGPGQLDGLLQQQGTVRLGTEAWGQRGSLRQPEPWGPRTSQQFGCYSGCNEVS